MEKEDYLKEDFVKRMRESYFREKKLRRLQGRAVILGIDLQRFFLDTASKAYLPSSKEFMGRITDFYDHAKGMGYEIILTKHCHENNIMSRWWGGDMPCDDMAEVMPEVEKYSSSIVEKNTYSAFYKTELEKYLHGVDIIIITGVMTHLCCETTARDAFVRGYNVIFPIDGTLTQNRELHEGSLRAISHGFAPTPTLEDLKVWMRQLE